MKLYHFTCIEHWPSISSAGKLTLADSNLMVGLEDMESISKAYALDYRETVQLPDGTIGINHLSSMDEPKVVHLTRNPERSAQALKWTHHAAVDKTRIRITVDVPILEAQKWTKWHDDKGGSQLMKKSLAETGGDWKSWCVCEREIPKSEWLEVVDLETGRVLWRRPDLNQPVTKDDVQHALELAYWVGMERARIVILNDRSMEEFYKYSMAVDHGSMRNVNVDEFEDYFFVFMSPQNIGLKDKNNRAILALGVKFKVVGGDVQGDFINVLTENKADFTQQRWVDLTAVNSEQCKVTAGGALLFNVFSHLYVDIRGFLATPCAHSESRRGPGAIAAPGKSRRKVDSNISVVVYRRPEKVIASRMAAAGTGRKLDHRIQVSGHFRNQWYSSTKSHKRIFVSEHAKGPDTTAPNPVIRVIKAVR